MNLRDYSDRGNFQWRPSVFAEDAARWQEYLARDRRITSDLTFASVEGGIILPLRASKDPRFSWQGGVLGRGGEFVAGHVFDPRLPHRRNVVSGYQFESAQFLPGTVVYAGGVRPDQFGHFLTESLSRLWWLRAHEASDVKVAFNRTYAVTPDHPHFSLLRLLGLTPERIIVIDEPTQFDRVIVPDQAFFLGSGDYHPEGMADVFDVIRDAVTSSDVRRIYLTRTQLTSRTAQNREINEEMFEKFYSAHDYQIVAPERLSLAEQVSALAGAEELASTAGSLAHLVLFCQDGIEQSILSRHERSMALEGQWGLSQFRKARTRVVDATVSVMPGSHTVGVVYFTSTEHWRNYVRAEFDGDVDVSRPEEYLVEYLRAWTDLVAATPKRFLERYPRIELGVLTDRLHRAFFDRPLDSEVRTRLDVADHLAEPHGAGGGWIPIVFDTKGGSLVAPQLIARGERVQRPPDPERAGFDFTGWFVSPRLKNQFDFDTRVVRDKTLHAKWSARR